MKLYASTAEMAKIIGRSPDWLKRRKSDGTFVEGVHYFHPNGERDPFWKIEAIQQWIESPQNDMVEKILEKVVSH